MPRTVDIPKYKAGTTDEINPAHEKLVDYLKRLIQMSETMMASRWQAWQETDRRHRTFVDVAEIDKITGKSRRPHDVKLILPLSYAIHHSVLTYLYTVFTAKEPLIALEGRKVDDLRAARLMEEVLDYDIQRQQGRLMLYAWLSDALRYGLGIVQDEWYEDHARKTVRTREPIEAFGIPMGTRTKEEKKWVRTYNGNRTFNIDPYLYLPDPRVPAGRVQHGDFVGYAWFRSWVSLKQSERSGKYQNVDDVTPVSREKATSASPFNQSARFSSLGFPTLWDYSIGDEDKGFVFGHTAWVKIVPSEFDLGSDDPELWVVSLANYDTVIRAEVWDYDSGEFPISVLEPHYDGYSPMNLGITEVVQPMTDMMDWLVGSHLDNVKKALNDMFVLDPSRINLDDLQRPGPAKWIRLRENAWGQDVKTAITQFPVQDVTKQHVQDVQYWTEVVLRGTGAVDSMLGMQPRQKQQATVFAGMVQMSAARHKVTAQILSEMGVLPWARRQVSNLQQFLDEDTFIKVTGNKAKELGVNPNEFLRVPPENIQGQFDYPVHTGEIPPDPQRNVQVWTQVLMAIAKTPNLAARFDLVEVFKQLVYSAGIKNIDAFLVKTQVMPDEQVMAMRQQGNAIPAQEALAQGNGGNMPQLPSGGVGAMLTGMQ
jgi:hypothetical protein